MMRARLAAMTMVLAGALAAAAAPAAAENPFEAPIAPGRPRIFIGRDGFEGLTVAKLREAVRGQEFAGIREKWRAKPLGRAILWMLDEKDEDLAAATSGLRRMDAAGGTWSDRGIALIEFATLFDWLHDRLEPSVRAEVAAKLERAADAAVEHIRGGQAPFFYTRTPGALAGMTLAGIALSGASPKAEGYLNLFRTWGVNEYFKAYEWVDGAATGATYTLFYTYVDLPSICAAWWSATGKNPTAWIRESQGGWLDDIVAFYLWYFRPGFAFTDINDQFRENWSTHDQYCQGLDIASYVTRDGRGRAWSGRWLGRWGGALYHTEYAHNFIFRDPALKPAPLGDLPRAQLFGRDSCGYGFFRSAWPAEGEPDTATHVFFRCGDPLDVHGGVAAGEFQVFRHAPLAARSGKYSSYDSAPDQYHRNCVSANVVLFTDPADPKDRGDQRTRSGLKADHRTWAEWLSIRERSKLDVASIVDWRVADGEARCRADLTRTNSPEKCAEWLREFVWLANRHLVVLDIVRTAKPETSRRWQLHVPAAPRVGGHRITVESKPPARSWADERLRPRSEEARLVCRTLLPKEYTVIVHARGKAETFNERGEGVTGPGATGPVPNPYHLEYGTQVIQIDPGQSGDRTVFLNVLTATDAADAPPPDPSCRLVGPGRLEVRVGEAAVTLEVPAWVVDR